VFINAKSPVQLENPPSGFKPLGGLAIEKLLADWRLPTANLKM